MTWDTYQDYPVMNTPPNWAQPVKQSFTTDVNVLQFLGIGRAWSQQAETALAWEAEFLLENRLAIKTLRDQFDTLKGRWGGFWAPTWQGDVKVTAAIASADTTLTIEDIQYGDYWGVAGYEVTGRYLMIRFPDGTQAYRRVMSWPTSTSLTLDAAVGEDVAESELGSLLVSFLHFVRFDQDELVLEYLTSTVARARLKFKAVPAEAAAGPEPEPEPAWYVDGELWTGLIKTVGASGRDYTTITAALADTSEDILLLVDAGTYTASLYSSLFGDRKVRIRGVGASFTDVVTVGHIYFSDITPLDVMIEWCNLTNTGYGLILPQSAGHTVTISKCRLYCSGTSNWIVKPDDGSWLSTWLFRQVKWDNADSTSDIRSANGTFDVTQMSMVKVWHTGASWPYWQFYRTTGVETLAANDTIFSATEPANYGPNYGDFLIVYE